MNTLVYGVFLVPLAFILYVFSQIASIVICSTVCL